MNFRRKHRHFNDAINVEQIIDNITDAMQFAYRERKDFLIEDINNLSYLEDEPLNDEEYYYEIDNILSELEEYGYNDRLLDDYIEELNNNGISYKKGLKDLIDSISQFANDLLTNWGGRV